MTGFGPAMSLDDLFSLDGLLLDTNCDGYPDGLRARFVLDGQPDAETWCALLDVAARLGLETAGLSFPLVVNHPTQDQIPIVVRPGTAREPTIQPDGWHGRLAVVVEGPRALRALAKLGSADRGRATKPFTLPTGLDLASLFEVGGLLASIDGDAIPDATRLCVIIPSALPPALGVALVHFVARVGLESGGIDLPIAVIGEPSAHSVPLRFDIRSGEPARLAAESGPALTLTGDPDAAAQLLERVARNWPVIPDAMDAPDAGDWLRRSLAGWTCEGRTARLKAELEKIEAIPDTGTVRLLTADPAERAHQARTARAALGSTVPVLGRGTSQIVFQHEWTARWEVDRLVDALRERVLPQLDPAQPVDLTIFVSEPPAIRRRVESLAQQMLTALGFPSDRCQLVVVDAFKPGLSWLREVVLPRWSAITGIAHVVIRFRPLSLPDGDSSHDMRIRWLQELFPADEIVADRLGLPLDHVTLEQLSDLDRGATYIVEALDAQGDVLATESFEQVWRRRPYLGLYPDAGAVHVTTGGIIARQAGQAVRELVPTDLELFWDYFQDEVLPQVRDHILATTDGHPTVEHQPLFEMLQVEVTVSEVDESLGIREERNSAAEALHEDIYFNALDFVETLGQHSSCQKLSAPGAVVPAVHVQPGLAPHARVTLTARPRAVAQLELGALRRPVGAVDLELPPRPPITGLTLAANAPQLEIELSQADAKTCDVLAGLTSICPPETGRPSLLIRGPRGLTFTVAVPRRDELPACPAADEPTSDAFIITEENLFRQLHRLARYPQVRVSLAGRSHQGRPIPAIEITTPVHADVWSSRKLSILKPSFLIVARHHANEVASTTAALQLVERLVEDPTWRRLLARVNLAVLPFENPDGAALHNTLQAEHPDWKHHPARYNAVGFEFSEHLANPDSPYGEARARETLWCRWLPDIVVDNHGVPSHEWVQVFAGFGSPPRFGVSYWLVQALIYGILHYVDDDCHPAHRQAAVALREAVARAVAADPELLDGNRRYRERYETWGHRWVQERFPLNVHREMIFYYGPYNMDTARAQRALPVRYPRTTVLSWVTEVPDETAHGPHLRRTAKAHLTANHATLELLAGSATPPIRRILSTGEGTRLTLGRSRPIQLGI